MVREAILEARRLELERAMKHFKPKPPQPPGLLTRIVRFLRAAI